MRRRSSGFSLIELLVVIAIIAVLGGLLLASIGPVKLLSRKMQCSSNLRQIGMCLLAYTQDYEGHFPAHMFLNTSSWPYAFGDWGGTIGSSSSFFRADFYWDYLPAQRSLFFCPVGAVRQTMRVPSVQTYWLNFPRKGSYWMPEINYAYFCGTNELNGNTRRGPRGTWDAKARSTLIADVMHFNTTSTDYTLVGEMWNHREGSDAPTSFRLNERSGGNLFHFDGHVDWICGTAELLKHRQKMGGNDLKSYCAVQKGDVF